MEFTKEQVEAAFYAFSQTTYDHWHDGYSVETLTVDQFTNALNFLMFPNREEFKPVQKAETKASPIQRLKFDTNKDY